ncbi:zinc finger and BTB domain-containing protein 17-like [Ostrinia furnacalis]|uniref:zinc finger and BTB domain-containing protein 17-like n=1 Tax=Ostrinia furnacalis TaxID=93504 RepID=UPI00103CBE47|nr:zinc finger and BTB domain-containing protein 17-like [Ostrinia furnacalis]
MKEKPSKSTKTKSPCPVCHKMVLGGSYNMKSHLYLHKVVAPRFQCGVCLKEFYRKDVYKRHLSVHRGDQKTHICDYCGRDFVDKRNLVKHFRIHDVCMDNDKNYTCQACDASYCEERLLKYHIRKEHFNLQQKNLDIDKKSLNETWVERVLETEVCVEMTKVNNNVIAIRKVGSVKSESQEDGKNVNNPFQQYMRSIFASKDKSQYSKAVCDYCNKEMLKKSLQSHIRERHLKLRRFKCETCLRTYNRHYQLVNHVCGKFRNQREKINH